MIRCSPRPAFRIPVPPAKRKATSAKKVALGHAEFAIEAVPGVCMEEESFGLAHSVARDSNKHRCFRVEDVLSLAKKRDRR